MTDDKIDFDDDNNAARDSKPRVNLGPKAVEYFGKVKNRKQALEDLIEEREILLKEREAPRRSEGVGQKFEQIFDQLVVVLAALEKTQSEALQLTQARYRRLDQLHLRTRALIGAKLTTGDAREKIFDALDRQSVKLQAHIDTLELSEARIAHTQYQEIERMQQLLREAGAHHKGMDQQIEMADLEPGGFER